MVIMLIKKSANLAQMIIIVVILYLQPAGPAWGFILFMELNPKLQPMNLIIRQLLVGMLALGCIHKSLTS